MANYNVDIGVSVRAQALRDFNQKLKGTEKSIDNLLLKLRRFNAASNFNELSSALSAANKNVNNAVRGTKTYEKALLEAAKAGRLLNKELSERARIQARLTNSESGFGAFSRQAAGLSGRQPRTQPLRVTRQRRRGLGQFSSPIGPSQAPMAGPQLPPNFNAEIKAAVAASRQVEASVERAASNRRKAAEEINALELDFNKKFERQQLGSQIKSFERKQKSNKESFDDLIKKDKAYGRGWERRLNNRTSARKRANTDVANQQRKLDKRKNDLLLGAGFPLLFGGGAGSIAGGVLGSAGGMGGQVFGSAIGGQLDQFAQRTTNLAQALRGAGDVTAELEGFIGVLNSETSRRIKNLEESGQTARAADAAFKELSKTIGVDNAKALVQAGKDFETLGSKTTQFFTILGASIASLFQEAFYLNLRDPLSDVPEASPELLNARRQAGQGLRLSQLETAAVRARGTSSFEDDAAADKAVINQKKLNDLAEVNRKVKEEQMHAEIGRNERLKITEDASRAILQVDQSLLRSREQQSKKEERLASTARRKKEKFASETKRLQTSLNAESIKAIDISVESARVFQGEEAAITRQLNLLERRKEFEADSIKLNTENLQIENLKLTNLDNEYNKKQEILLQTLEQLRLTEQVFALSSAAGFDVLSVANNIAPFQRGMGTEGSPVSFEAGMELAPLIAYQVELDKILEKYPMIGEAATAAAGLVTFGVKEMIDGTKSAEQVFADFLNSIAEMLMKTAQQMIAQYIAMGIARMFAGFNPSSFSSFSGSMSGGNPFSPGTTFNVPAGFADGGRPPVGRPSIVGERGPELFVPGASGTIIPNHALGSGANVTVNVDASGSSVEGDGDQAAQLGKMLGAAVQAELIKQKRPGGLLSS